MLSRYDSFGQHETWVPFSQCYSSTHSVVRSLTLILHRVLGELMFVQQNMLAYLPVTIINLLQNQTICDGMFLCDNFSHLNRK